MDLTPGGMKKSAVILVAVGIAVGVLASIGFDTAMKATSTQEFCLSCHEMEAFPWQESLAKPHQLNQAGIGVSCGDCHIPKEFVPKMKRKVIAAREVWHHMLGTLDSPEKYEAYRLKMAESVWASMKADDSASCRHCHDAAKMSVPGIKNMHQSALNGGATCIDCHKGIAHKLPQ